MAQQLTFSAIENSSFTAPITKKLKQHYQAIGINIDVIPMPAARAISEISSGKFDGELFRIKAFETIYRDLIRIDIPLARLEGVILSTKANLAINSMDDVRNYVIGIRKGVLFSDLTTRGLNIIKVNSNHQLIEMLLKKRVDLVFMSKDNAVAIIKQQDIQNVHLYSVIQLNLYHFLHKKHQDIAHRLTKQLELNSQL